MLNRRLLLLGAGALAGAPVSGTTVLYEGRETSLGQIRVVDGDLWVEARELPKLNGFEVKPQGACRGDVCIPLPKTLKNKSMLNLSGFARKVKQASVREGDLWSFGEIPTLRSGFLESRIAPGFAIRDRKGKDVRLEDFRGRKVLLVTWASW